MASSDNFQTKRLDNFNRSYSEVIKTHYRQNRQDKEKFERQVADYIDNLRKSPRPPRPAGHTEPWPNGTFREGWELWKLEFDMPGLKGQAKHGRLIYIIDTQRSIVYLLWIYTHKKFAGRPPEASLRQLLNEAAEERQKSDQNKNEQ